MAKIKRESFHATSPINLTDTEDRTDDRGNLQADWARYNTLSPHIDGKPLKAYLTEYNNFGTEADVIRFFKEVLLVKATLKPKQEEAAVNFLLTYFRQKGFMQPVTVMLERTLLVESINKPHEYQLSGNFTNQEIDIRTTDQGFSIQEVATVTKLNKIDKYNGLTERIESTNPSYLVKAEGTIDFDFSQRPASPTMTVQSNFISYGHPEIQSLLDKRSILEWLVDCIRQILGGLNVEIREHAAPDEDNEDGRRMSI